MRRTSFLFSLILSAGLTFGHGSAAAQNTISDQDIPYTITYQGMLGSSGVPLPDDDYMMTVTLYGDPEGTTVVWNGTYTTALRRGVFNLRLGGGDHPLPPAASLDRRLWVGVRVDGGSEMRPLTPLTASPYALNIGDGAVTSRKLADGAVTADKIDANYVSEIRVNGETITGRGSALNITGTGIEYDRSTGSVVIGRDNAAPTGSKQGATTMGTASDSWAMHGNGVDPTGAAVNPDNNDWIGTGTLSPPVNFVVKVNNQRVVVYDASGTTGTGTPNIIAGSSANSISSGSEGSVIAGGGSSNLTTTLNQILGDSKYSAISGGLSNTAGTTLFQADYVTIGGGYANIASDEAATIAGGQENEASGIKSFIGGGRVNKAMAPFSTIGGGTINEAYTGYSTIGGGEENKTYGSHSTVGGGGFNVAGDSLSTVGGGDGNVAGGVISTVGGGRDNSAPGEGSAVGGGEDNLAYRDYTAVAGGLGNIAGNVSSATGSYAAIGGGQENEARADHAFIGGGKMNDALAARSSVVGGELNVASGTNAFVGSGFENLAANVDAAVAGGRGNDALGIGSFIGAGRDHVALYNWTTIGGGDSNRAEGTWSTVAGGRLNHAVLNNSTIGGGDMNTASGHTSTIAGGVLNVANNFYAAITGGNANRAQYYAAVGGGNRNLADGNFSFIGGGQENQALGTHTSIPGGFHLTANTSFAQNVVGFYNAVRGSMPFSPNQAQIDASADPLFIVGNGTKFNSHNAFEVTYNGHSIVYDLNGSGGASLPPAGVDAVTPGATYVDNIIYGWGYIDAGGNTVSDFGVASSLMAGPGIYMITLNVADPYTGAPVNLTDASITATIVDEQDPFGPPHCSTISVTPIGRFGPNTFYVRTSRLTGFDCMPEPMPFMFKVTGRP